MSKVADKTLDKSHALLFKQLLQQYETKEYKKGVKTADMILKKYSTHGETMAMKGLILTNLDKKEEGWEYVRKGLRNDLKSQICWRVYGLLYRAEKNYEESMKCYLNALKYDPGNIVVLRDLAVMQSHLRVYSGLLDSRKSLLKSQPDYRGHHTALAVAYHLNGDYVNAEKVLKEYDDKLLVKPKNNHEHSTTALYQNTIIAESGATERALAHLSLIESQVLDKLEILERRARYNLILGKLEESERLYRHLLDLNPDCYRYYTGLEKSLKLCDADGKIDSERVHAAQKVYQELQTTYPKAAAPRRRPLNWLTGDDFRAAIDPYLRNLLQKGVPSTFVEIKALYKQADKADTIESLVESYLEGYKLATSSATNGVNGDKHDREAPTSYLWTLYFLAQSYDHRRKLDKAMETINEALEHTPTLVELHLTKARILKHMGSPSAAAEQMNIARELDLQDRFINTKSTKYYLRADQNGEAIATISLFVNSTLGGGTIGDLESMQSVSFILEDGLSYARQSLLGLALKRFETVKKSIDQWFEDQFDFHQYCFRIGTIDSYMASMHWEDSVYLHPIYKRAAHAAVLALLRIHRDPSLKQGPLEAQGVSDADRKKEKKRIQKIRAARSKDATREAEKKDGVDMHRKLDSDPLGDKLLATTEPLEDALSYLAPWLHDDAKDSNALLLQAEVLIEQGKLDAAVHALSIAKHARKAHYLQYKLKCHDSDKSESVVQYLENAAGLTDSVSEWNTKYVESADTTEEFLQGLQVSLALKEDVSELILKHDLDMTNTSLAQAREMLQMITAQSTNDAAAEQFRKKIKSIWTLAEL